MEKKNHTHIFIPVKWIKSETKTGDICTTRSRVIQIMCQICTEFRVIQENGN